MSKEVEIATLGTGIPFEPKNVHSKKEWKREVWESKRKCRDEKGQMMPAVRVEITYFAGNFNRATVSEIKGGKLFTTSFNSSLNPINISDRKVADEHLRNLLGLLNPVKSETEKNAWQFFRYVIGEEQYSTKIQDNWSIRIPIGISRLMGLEVGGSCKLCWEGEYLILTPLKETEMPAKIYLSSTSEDNIRIGKVSFTIVVPESMLLAAGLKVGEYGAWSEESGLFRLTKAEKDTPYARKLQRLSSNSASITIPHEIAEKAHIRPGQYGFWTFLDDGINKSLWLEVREKRDVAKITKVERDYGPFFEINIPKSMREKFEKGDTVLLQVREGRLYIKKENSSI
ncbi:MAG: hypothetical protein QXF56_05190 [Candidatus Micrarchaeia archaeon]